MLRFAASLCTLALAVAFTGCGRDTGVVESTAERFYDAVREDDGSAACELLCDDTANTLEKEEKAPCEEAVLELELEGARAESAEIFSKAAEVQLRGGDRVFLGEGRDGWKIDAAGCQPTGDPQEEPYDCEVEA